MTIADKLIMILNLYVILCIIILKLLLVSMHHCISNMTLYIAGSGESTRFHKQGFSQRVVCLKQYVDDNEGLQMRVLYALQVAVNKQKCPPGQ